MYFQTNNPALINTPRHRIMSLVDSFNSNNRSCGELNEASESLLN